MTDDLTLTVEEREERRTNQLLGRDKPRSPSVADQERAALEKLRDTDNDDPDATLRDYIDAPENHERESYRSHRHAADVVAQKEAEQAEIDREATERQKREAAEQERQEAESAGQVNENEAAELRAFQERMQQYETALQEYQRWAQDENVTDQQRQQAEQILDQERQNIEAGREQAQRFIQQKQLAGGRAQLPKELGNDEVRERFIKRLEREGIPRKRIEAETDPATIGKLFAQFKHEERQEAARAKQRKVAEHARQVAARRGSQEPPKDSRQAKEQLQKSGNMRDAATYLSIKRAERLL